MYLGIQSPREVRETIYTAQKRRFLMSSILKSRFRQQKRYFIPALSPRLQRWQERRTQE